MLWESGGSLIRAHPCRLELKYGQIHISAGSYGPTIIWSPQDTKFSKELWDIGLSLSNGEFWLICTFRDGNVHKYQAIPGTNSFELVAKTNDFSFMLDL